ncbi:MAG TPA: hypothetical protein VND22_07705 [Actinomycetota bacterium]|nr:hypothetical protein [Actinomycetota bacterium]
MLLVKCEACGAAVRSESSDAGQCASCGQGLTGSATMPVSIAIGMQDFSDVVTESSITEDIGHTQLPEAFAREDLIRVS